MPDGQKSKKLGNEVRFRLQHILNLFQETWISGKVFQTENINKWLNWFKDISSHLKFSLKDSKKFSFCFPTPIFLLCFFHVSGVEIKLKDPEFIVSEYWTGHLCWRLHFQQMEVDIILLVFRVEQSLLGKDREWNLTEIVCTVPNSSSPNPKMWPEK